jgi:hypothetical protein
VQLQKAVRLPVFQQTDRLLRQGVAAPLLWLRPLQGSTQHSPPTLAFLRLRKAAKTARQLLSWSFAPLRRVSPSESTPPRLATPGTFRPQGFSPSRRLAPRSNAQPCFMLVTSMGFCSSGGFPHCQVPTARRRGNTLLAFFLRIRRENSAMLGARTLHTGNSAYAASLFSPSGLCSNSESVPLRDCYLRRGGRSPPELYVASPGFCSLPSGHAARHVCRSCALTRVLPRTALGQAQNRP